MATIAAAERRADAETLLREVEADARVAAQPVELAPDDLRRVDATLHHEIFDQPAEIVDGQRRHGGGALAPAFAHGARDVVFAAAFPHLEAARVAHAAEPRIEAQHHFTERGAVPAGFGSGADLQDVVRHLLAPDRLDEFHGVTHARFDAGVVGLREQLLRDQVAADAAGDDARAVPLAQGFLGRLHAAGRHDARP